MRRYLLAICLASVMALVGAVDAAASASVGQPGFYGRLDFGDNPPPRLIYQQPVMVRRVPMSRPPVYLHVPLVEARNWRKYCGNYKACGERAYFVQNTWYEREYVPNYQGRHGNRWGRGEPE